ESLGTTVTSDITAKRKTIMRAGLGRLGLSVVLVVAGARAGWAGGYYQTVDLTQNRPGPEPGSLAGVQIPMRWDERCIPVQFRVNGTLDPVPNPLGTAFLSVAEASAVLQQALEIWTDIPTSFIDMRVVGTTSNPGFRGFDMVNEITFRPDLTPEVVGYSTLTPRVGDTTLTAGDDLDGDGDVDVAAGITVCQDVDGDGDIEFPAGFYRAGTILDSDVELNADVFRFTTAAQAADT